MTDQQRFIQTHFVIFGTPSRRYRLDHCVPETRASSKTRQLQHSVLRSLELPVGSELAGCCVVIKLPDATISPPSLKDARSFWPQRPRRLRRSTLPWTPQRNKFRLPGEILLPSTADCVNLTSVTYAPDRTSTVTAGSLHIKTALSDIPEKYRNEKAKGGLMKEDKEVHPNFSTSYLRFSSQILGQW
ncbi:hypothetical protein B0H13DRAFT_1872705 [Mycena leptocephala]|nr:hypothetical protein B0H13DRAFT_1872705 [Mycena leptocephala]